MRSGCSELGRVRGSSQWRKKNGAGAGRWEEKQIKGVVVVVVVAVPAGGSQPYPNWSTCFCQFTLPGSSQNSVGMISAISAGVRRMHSESPAHPQATARRHSFFCHSSRLSRYM